MRQRGLLLGLIVAGASFAMEAPTASSHEMERFPVRLAAFLPRSPLPLDFKPTSDEHYTGWAGSSWNVPWRVRRRGILPNLSGE